VALARAPVLSPLPIEDLCDLHFVPSIGCLPAVLLSGATLLAATARAQAATLEVAVGGSPPRALPIPQPAPHCD
jgi:hypothetical protein